MTAHTTTHSRVQRDFPASGERPRIGGVCCRRLVSANVPLDLGGRFGAFVSGPRNPVSWRRRSLSAETGSNPELRRGKSEHLMLPRPLGWHVAETGDSHSAG